MEKQEYLEQVTTIQETIETIMSDLTQLETEMKRHRQAPKSANEPATSYRINDLMYTEQYIEYLKLRCLMYQEFDKLHKLEADYYKAMYEERQAISL